MNRSTAANATTEPCSTFNPFDCVTTQLDAEHQFLALVIVALAIAVCVLCLLVCILSLLVHKISTIWMAAALGKMGGADKGDPTDNPRKGLLGNTIKSSFASRGDTSGAKKGKKTSFAEDTSCAPPRDVDEEDL